MHDTDTNILDNIPQGIWREGAEGSVLRSCLLLQKIPMHLHLSPTGHKTACLPSRLIINFLFFSSILIQQKSSTVLFT